MTIAEGDTKSLDCALQHKCMNTLDVEMCFRRNCGERCLPYIDCSEYHYNIPIALQLEHRAGTVLHSSKD